MITNLTKLTLALPGIIAIAAFVACNSDVPGDLPCPNNEATGDPSGSGGSGGSTGAGASTGTSMTEYSAQEVAAKLHGCRKLRYETLGTYLNARGVDTVDFGGSAAVCQTDGTPSCPSTDRCYCPVAPCAQVGANPGNNGICVKTPETTGFLYTTGQDAFSVPKMDSRRSEKDGHTSASALRLFDIFIQAAPQIIQNIEDPSKAPACVLNGESFPMFDPVEGTCVPEAISCLIGYPATDDHVLLCNLILEKADPFDTADVTRKQHIAVASMLAAALSCE